MASGMLFNIGGPPRYTIDINHSVVDVAISFNPEVLAKLLKCEVYELPKKCETFVEEHKDRFTEDSKPKGYMINLNKNTKKIVECNDIYLLISVFGSTVGEIYIPNRKLSFYPSSFTRTLYFSKKEVFSNE